MDDPLDWFISIVIGFCIAIVVNIICLESLVIRECAAKGETTVQTVRIKCEVVKEQSK